MTTTTANDATETQRTQRFSSDDRRRCSLLKEVKATSIERSAIPSVLPVPLWRRCRDGVRTFQRVMRTPWSWRGKGSSWSGWRGRGSRRRGSSRARGARSWPPTASRKGELPAEALSLAEKGVRLELGGHRAETFTGADAGGGVAGRALGPARAGGRARARRAGDGGAGAGVPVPAGAGGGGDGHQGQVHDHRGAGGHAARDGARRARGRQHRPGRDRAGGGRHRRRRIFVLEVSSFQLEGTDTFRPQVAVFLNLSADHLDRHASFEEYARGQGAHLPQPDRRRLGGGERRRSRACWRWRGGPGAPGSVPFRRPPGDDPDRDEAFFAGDDGRGCASRRAARRSSAAARCACPAPTWPSDLLAAAAAARLLGAAPEAIARAVRAFRGVEHVLERVAEVGGVAFFNDSKATNVDAARRSLEAFAGPVLAIIGGRYKGGDFADLGPGAGSARQGRCWPSARRGSAWRDALSAVVPVVRLRQPAGGGGARPARPREPGDTVLLAPACSSFDMFRDYAERGRAFKRRRARAGGTRTSERGWLRSSPRTSRCSP